MEMHYFFETNEVEMSDGSELYEVVTPDGERVATTTDKIKAMDLEQRLNQELSEWAAEIGSDATVG